MLSREVGVIRLVRHRIWTPSPSDPLDLETTVEAFILRLTKDYQLVGVYFDPYQMRRVAFVLRLYPDKIEAYRETHRAVWPEMIAANRSAGVRNHTMFLHGNLAFGYLECDDYAKTRAILDESDVVKRWGELHLGIFDPGDGPTMQTLEEAFHQD